MNKKKKLTFKHIFLDNTSILFGFFCRNISMPKEKIIDYYYYIQLI